jgi:hypothetical protein
VISHASGYKRETKAIVMPFQERTYGADRCGLSTIATWMLQKRLQQADRVDRVYVSL